jgi:hypothetical protein
VEATSDVVILRPAHPNGILLFEIPNRGRMLISVWFDNRSNQGSVRLDQDDEDGRGFMLSNGYTQVWAGWWRMPAGAGLLGIQVPVAPGSPTRAPRVEFRRHHQSASRNAELSCRGPGQRAPSVRARADDLRQTHLSSSSASSTT